MKNTLDKRARKEPPEVTAEQLAAMQREIDAQLPPGITFRSVGRAAW